MVDHLGKEELHHLTAMGGSVQGEVCARGGVRRWHLVISRDLARPHSPPTAWFKEVRSEGRAQCGMRSGRKVHMGGKVGGRWVASEVEEVV